LHDAGLRRCPCLNGDQVELDAWASADT
jgi:hypothetical protein